MYLGIFLPRLSTYVVGSKFIKIYLHCMKEPREKYLGLFEPDFEAFQLKIRSRSINPSRSIRQNMTRLSSFESCSLVQF